MNTIVFNRQTDLDIDEESVSPIVQFVLQQEKERTDEVTVHFVSEEEISRLHALFFDDPSPTDCISFPMDRREKSPYHILGELFLCPKVAIEYVRDHKEVLHDYYTEATLYLVHALLHLLGYKDEEESDRHTMHAIQNEYIRHLAQKKILLKCQKI